MSITQVVPAGGGPRCRPGRGSRAGRQRGRRSPVPAGLWRIYSLTGDRSAVAEQAWHRAVPRSGRLSGMIKRVNRHEPHVLQIASSAWCSRSCPTSPGPRRRIFRDSSPAQPNTERDVRSSVTRIRNADSERLAVVSASAGGCLQIRQFCSWVRQPRRFLTWTACLGSPGAGGVRRPCLAYGGYQHETGCHSTEGLGPGDVSQTAGAT